MDDNFQYHMRRGLACDHNADHESAVLEFSRAVEARPDAPIAYLYRALSNDECGDPADTEADLEKAISLAPDFAESFFARAFLLFRRQVLTREREKADLYAEVIGLYSEAIDRDPALLPAYHHRGWLRYDLEDYQGALEDFNRCIEIDRAFPMGYIRRSQAWGKLGNLRAAIKDLEYYLDLPAGAIRNQDIVRDIAAYWYQLSLQA